MSGFDTSASDSGNNHASGKGHKDENFPVASWIIKRDYRAPIMSFYKFARAADDIADHPTATPDEKLAQLAWMRAGLTGEGAPLAMALAEAGKARGLDLIHANDLLDAFVQDVTIHRYADWEALIGYCRNSAMPVGRFVLDVHGEDRSLWPLSDALCAALQVINHLQDCGKDYRAIDRVYVPTGNLEAAGIGVEALAASQACPALRLVIAGLAGQSALLLQRSAPFAAYISDRRLSAEVAVIHMLAEDLVRLLRSRDPLSENVYHTNPRAAVLAFSAIVRNTFARRRR
jgi:squalene synthase HpnC